LEDEKLKVFEIINNQLKSIEAQILVAEEERRR
jgi:hypothetical protein